MGILSFPSLTQGTLQDFAHRGFGKFIQERDRFGNPETGSKFQTMVNELRFGDFGPRVQDYKGFYLFAIHGVGNPYYGCLQDSWVFIENLFQGAGRNIFSPADDQVLLPVG
jgi:hypothetical protein